jgi:hypothetical protein
METAVNDEQLINASVSILESFEPDSNPTTSSEAHPKKQRSDIISTEAGIQIDFSDRSPEKHRSPIRVVCDPSANVT